MTSEARSEGPRAPFVRGLRGAFRRRSRRAMVGLAVLFLGLGLAAARPFAGAQTGGGGSAARTPLEEEAYQLYLDQQMLSARTKAEEVLEQDPSSIVGHFVMGAVLHEAEGSLARAMYHLGRAREVYETTFSPTVQGVGAPTELHRELLFKIQALAGELEKHEYRLEILGWHDYLYDPDLLAEQAWALIPLQRYDEAREFADRAAASQDEFQRSSGLNALCAIEGEAATRGPFLDACVAALENARRRAEESEDGEGAITVHAYNAAAAALANLRYDQAESLALEGARRLEITPANPWRELARLYLDQGRLTEAAEALREMNRWKRRQPAYLRDQDRAETEVAFATVLLVAGRTQLGLDAVDRALQQPDRRGLTSSSAEQALGAHALLRRSLRRVAAEQAAEEAAARGLFASLTHGLGAAFGESFADDERIRSVLSDDERLTSTFRPYVKGGLEPVPTWLLGDLVAVLGPGVSVVAVERARAVEPPDSPALPFYGALEAEARLAQGDEERALELAQRALEDLPEQEQLLRARLHAVAAIASEDRGLAADALGHLERALQIDGGVLRRLGLAIPARITSSGGELADDVAAALRRSPRFDDAPGFQVTVRGGQGSPLEACLLSGHGARLGCESVDPLALRTGYQEAVQRYEEARLSWAEAGREGDEPTAPEPKDPVRELARAFQDRVFSAAVTLSGEDLNSLDGRTTAGAEVARDRMESLLDQAED